MNTVGSYEAKTHLSQLLQRVVNGEQITITRHGVSIARLVPVVSEMRHDLKTTVEAIRQFRNGRWLGQLSIREMIREGRRF